MISLAGAGTVVLGAVGAASCAFALVFGVDVFNLEKTQQVVGRIFIVLGSALMGGSFCYMSYWIGKSLLIAASAPMLDISIKAAGVGFVAMLIGSKIENDPLIDYR